MLDYRFFRQMDDGTWRVQLLKFADDDDAISYGLVTRSANRCELYQAERWLATFDGARQQALGHPLPVNDNIRPGKVEETR